MISDLIIHHPLPVCSWKMLKFNRSTNAVIKLTTVLNGGYTKGKLDLEFHPSGLAHCCGNQGTEEGYPENQGLSSGRREIWGAEGRGVRSFPPGGCQAFEQGSEGSEALYF